jgi:hypothetical protein
MEKASTEQHAERPRLRLILNERVEMALRYLDEKERRQVLRRLKILEFHSPQDISGKFPRLASDPDAEAMFLLRLSKRLRAIFRYPGNGTVVVEDLASHEVLSRYFRRIES